MIRWPVSAPIATMPSSGTTAGGAHGKAPRERRIAGGAVGGPAHHLRAVYILANGFVAQGYGSLVDLMVVSYLEFYENRCPDVG